MHKRKYLFVTRNLDSYGLQKPFPHFICVRVCELEKAVKEFWIQNENFKIILFSLSPTHSRMGCIIVKNGVQQQRKHKEVKNRMCFTLNNVRCEKWVARF